MISKKGKQHINLMSKVTLKALMTSASDAPKYVFTARESAIVSQMLLLFFSGKEGVGSNC